MENGAIHFRTPAFGYGNTGGDDMYGPNILNTAPVGPGFLSAKG